MSMPLLFDVGVGATRRRFVCMGLSALVVAGLAGCAEAKPAPRTARLKRENCHYCGMPVSDPRYVAEIWDNEYGRVRVYDDFGCAVIDACTRGELDRNDIGFWVADESDPARWLDARSARYRAGVATPMGHGHAAGPESGHPLDFAAACAAIRAKALCDHQS